jgi:hypothetical protein
LGEGTPSEKALLFALEGVSGTPMPMKSSKNSSRCCRIEAATVSAAGVQLTGYVIQRFAGGGPVVWEFCASACTDANISTMQVDRKEMLFISLTSALLAELIRFFAPEAYSKLVGGTSGNIASVNSCVQINRI